MYSYIMESINVVIIDQSSATSQVIIDNDMFPNNKIPKAQNVR